MNAKLIVVGGTTGTTEVNLRLPTIIGRGRSVQVTIPHSLVSRQHCEISEVGGRLVVRDLDSLNGTYVGDERITEAILEPGALLTIGTVTFRAIYELGCDDDSQGDGPDNTCLSDEPISEADDLIGTDLQRKADFQTVPVRARSGEASDEAATESTPDRADVSSLASAAKNSD